MKTKKISRPRFRRSKRSGINLRSHPRYSSFNTPSLGMHNSTFEPKRVSDVYSMDVYLRSCLKDYYGVRQGKAKLTGSTFVRATSKWKLKCLDRRIDVLLHRSGLVNSIMQARQLISHGHVIRSKSSDGPRLSKDGPKLRKVTKPRLILGYNNLVFIDYHSNSTTLSHLTSMSMSQWSKWSSSRRFVPPYVEVDYINGSLVLVNKPSMQTILIPAGLGKTVSMCAAP